MTTKSAGGKITGVGPALTCESAVAMTKKTPVQMVAAASYEVEVADGTKPIVGHVSVANVKRSGPSYPVAETPGEVTVESRGYGVETFLSAGALDAGIEVGFNAAGRIAAVGAGVPKYGISLNNTTAADQDIDVLIQ